MLVDRADALHTPREPWGVSVYDIFAQLTGIPTTAAWPYRRAVLPGRQPLPPTPSPHPTRPRPRSAPRVPWRAGLFPRQQPSCGRSWPGAAWLFRRRSAAGYVRWLCSGTSPRPSACSIRPCSVQRWSSSRPSCRQAAPAPWPVCGLSSLMAPTVAPGRQLSTGGVRHANPHQPSCMRLWWRPQSDSACGAGPPRTAAGPGYPPTWPAPKAHSASYTRR